MPTIKGLNELTNPEAADSLAIVDESAVTTKYVKIGTLLKLIYPVGSIYFNATDDTNPATLLGFGTWAAFGSGRVPVGQDAADADFDTLSEAGGSKSHWHWQTVGADGGAMYAREAGAGASPANSKVQGGASRIGVGRTFGPSNDNGRYDGTEAASSLAPYIVVKMWRRTA